MFSLEEIELNGDFGVMATDWELDDREFKKEFRSLY